ncbi:MAG UNVERIFIED_CONTAM: glycosyltransferase family 39 protein [Anaerolineae bacterium]
MSLLLGLVTLVGTFQSAKLVLQSEKWAAIATAWVAFNPMFLFISASVNNDNLVIALNSLVIWLLLRMIERGYEPVTFWVLPILVALASLSKLSGNIPVPVIALVALVLSWRTKRWGEFFRLGFTLLGVWLVVSGWWYGRNLALYGELFGTRMMAQVAGERLSHSLLMTLWQEFEGFRIAYWGLFGAVNILTWNGFYRLTGWFCAGCMCWACHNNHPRQDPTPQDHEPHGNLCAQPLPA